eukprot:CAMPEP_0194317348 /NCGR_PEP_ID=MMETSP0171-20130528/14093_1 /TAXON_ID=218684 /ORGANISM="Corethron pennatum, Strain L29A3" /LENGTH=37 /DNA_ID= /DNA_START= /DNA_END= /DNA_ORIENTATION=
MVDLCCVQGLGGDGNHYVWYCGADMTGAVGVDGALSG